MGYRERNKLIENRQRHGGQQMSEPPSRSNDPWSIEEDKQLRRLMAEGNSARAIAARLKRTTRAVRRRAERLHLSWRKRKLVDRI